MKRRCKVGFQSPISSFRRFNSLQIKKPATLSDEVAVLTVDSIGGGVWDTRVVDARSELVDGSLFCSPGVRGWLPCEA